VFDFIIVLGSITDIIYTEVTVSVLSRNGAIFMAALCNRAGHYIFAV